jgi:hypothetical protein
MQSDLGNDDLLEKVARAMAAKDSGPEGSVLFEIHWREFGEGYLSGAVAALAVARPAIREECAEKVKGQRLIWNKGTSAYTALTDAEAAIRAME